MRTQHELEPWLHEAIVQQTDPLGHICRRIADGLRAGSRTPGDAARLLVAAAEAFPGGATPAVPPTDLAHLAAQMRSLEHAFAETSLPGDIVMMSATAHAHRCLGIGIHRVQTRQEDTAAAAAVA